MSCLKLSLRTGVLCIKGELCPRNFIEEINYWGVRIKNSRRCCRISFEERQDELNEQLKVQRQLLAEVCWWREFLVLRRPAASGSVWAVS